MSNVVYSVLSRQSGLEKELISISNNIANASTTGFRGERHVFSEYIQAISGEPSVSHTRVGARAIELRQGELIPTNGSLDVAIVGRGFFVVETPLGERLTRAGSFASSADNLLITSDGFIVQGEGGAIAIPGDIDEITISSDGSISTGGGVVGKLRTVDVDVISLVREGNTFFRSTGPVENKGVTIRQGFIESSNVSAVVELARMIEVQRAFEIGSQFLSEENERIARAIETFGRRR